jgi:hypothetical protein
LHTSIPLQVQQRRPALEDLVVGAQQPLVLAELACGAGAQELAGQPGRRDGGAQPCPARGWHPQLLRLRTRQPSSGQAMPGQPGQARACSRHPPVITSWKHTTSALSCRRQACSRGARSRHLSLMPRMLNVTTPTSVQQLAMAAGSVRRVAKRLDRQRPSACCSRPDPSALPARLPRPAWLLDEVRAARAARDRSDVDAAPTSCATKRARRRDLRPGCCCCCSVGAAVRPCISFYALVRTVSYRVLVACWTTARWWTWL